MFEEDVHNLPLDGIQKKPKSPVVKRRTKPQPKPNREQQHPATVVIPQKEKFFGLDPSGKPAGTKSRKRWVWFSVLLLFLLLLSAAGWWASSISQRIFQNSNPLSFFSNFGNLVANKDEPLKGEEQGKINILLLGIGGENHEGGTLTDTMILATLKLAGAEGGEPQVSLLSVPRDYVVKLPGGYEFRKINSAYAYGELEEDGGGATWAMQVMGELTGEDIPYYAVIDFQGFEDIINDLGGIDVYIERSFSDSAYPDARYGYIPTLKFEQGWEHMNGERALQFARSRHGTNGEGGDFARAARQQKILLAIKEKAEKLRLSTSLSTITRLIDTFSKNFKTNLEPWEAKKLYEMAKEVPKNNIKSLSLDYNTGLICSDIVEETGAAILTLCPGKTKADLLRFIADRFDNTTRSEENASILILNATRVNFLAKRAADGLNLPGAKIDTGNFPGNEVPRNTVIHDLSAGEKPQTLSYLKENLVEPVVVTTYPYPDLLPDPKPDIVIVLGTAAAENQ